ARVTLGDNSSEASFSVVKDPRSFASDTEIENWVKTLADMKALLTEALQTLNEARQARTQIQYLMSKHDNEQLHSLGKQAIKGINGWEEKITQLKHETYEDEDAWATMLDGQLRFLMDTIDRSGAPVTEGMRSRQVDLTEAWSQLQDELQVITDSYINPINSWANERREPHVVRPAEGG
ncbi:MAG: hypothetical protein AAF438_16180, partial [Pseudomonadota bacterium]